MFSPDFPQAEADLLRFQSATSWRLDAPVDQATRAWYLGLLANVEVPERATRWGKQGIWMKPLQAIR
jgi:hypothetical protein